MCKFRQICFSAAVLSAILMSGILFAYQDSIQENFKYALGLYRKGFFKEADIVLDKIIKDPRPFDQADEAYFWLAEANYKLENWTKAAACYTEIINSYPESPYYDRSAYGLGWTHMKDMNPKSALEAFAKVSKKDKVLYTDAVMKRGYILAKYSFPPQQIIDTYELLKPFEQLDQTMRFDAYLQTAIAKFNLSIYRQALPDFEKALAITPNPESARDILFYMGECAFRTKQYKEAIAYYENTIKADPDSSSAHKAAYSMAWCYIYMADNDKAADILKQQVENPKSAVRSASLKTWVDILLNLRKFQEAADSIDKYLFVLSVNDPLKPELAYMRALALYSLNQFGNSERAFKEFLDNYKDSPRVYEATYRLGLSYIGQKDFTKAINTLLKLAENTKTPADVKEKALYRLGESYFNLGNVKDAGKYFNQIVTKFPKGETRIDALYQLGELAYLQESFDEALTAFSLIAESGKPLASQALFRSGEVAMRAAKIKEAINLFETYLKKYPQASMTDDAKFKIGLAWLELNDDAQALAAFSQLLNSEGYFRQEARFNIAKIAQKAGSYALAIQNYKAIISEAPESTLVPAATEEVANCLYSLKDYASASESYREALKMRKTESSAEPRIRINLGKSLAADKKATEGALEILRVPVLHPNSPHVAEAYYEAALIYAGYYGVQDIDLLKADQLLKEAVKHNIGSEKEKTLQDLIDKAKSKTL